MICVTWWGLTQYAARAIDAFAKVSVEQVFVVATRPKSTLVKGLEKSLNCPLVWVDENDSDVSLTLPEVPRILLVSNWNLPCWRSLMSVVRARGGRIVAMVDTNYQLTVKAILRAIRFRLLLRHKFDAFMVAGRSGLRLMRMWGVDERHVYQGLYGADASLFHDGDPIGMRAKRILYVGQFIARKNVLRLLTTFEKFHAKYPDWELEMCGHGPLHVKIPKMQGLVVHDFVQPEELSRIYRQVRAFVLPSIEEHWGVVVHEASLSGCYLLLSSAIGAKDDFASNENSAIFNPTSEDSILAAFEKVASLSPAELHLAQRKSVELSAKFGLSRFVLEMQRLVNELDTRLAR